MRGTLRIATILSLLFGGVAYAGHGHGGGGGGVVVRDHRGGGGPAVVSRGPVVRDHRGGGGAVTRVRVSNGRYVFPGGVVRVYQRPVIREHYYNVRVRPPLIVESYEPVDGYVWMRGNWTWGGSEWVWTPGYWAVAEEPAPVVTGGFGVSAGISIH